MELIPLHPIEVLNLNELRAEYDLAEWNVEQAIVYMRDVLTRMQILGESPDVA